MDISILILNMFFEIFLFFTFFLLKKLLLNIILFLFYI